MVRLPVPRTVNSNSKLLSKKNHCLSLLKLSSSVKHVSQIHAQILVSGLQQDTNLLTELIRFCSLSPSKHLSYAHSLLYNSLDSLPPSWNFLIRGYASGDAPKNAIRVFHRMRKEGVGPNNFTFPFVLKACATCLALEEGKQVHADIFKFGLDCDVYVNNNLVHLYGSCKRVWDAYKVRKKLLELEPRRSENFVIIANMYADAGMWETATNVRRTMRDGGLKKIGGESCIVLEGSIHQFFSGCSKDDHESIKLLLDGLNLHMKMVNSL
ncbi:hypothetical protein D5086_030633 [Populus alba]|uniref:Uncharacterized protein n=1 Tax=Populus alba TaxID=43335 RepID=A0ACC4AQ08_POPAL